jgi:hypothetical protein
MELKWIRGLSQNPQPVPLEENFAIPSQIPPQPGQPQGGVLPHALEYPIAQDDNPDQEIQEIQAEGDELARVLADPSTTPDFLAIYGLLQRANRQGYAVYRFLVQAPGAGRSIHT